MLTEQEQKLVDELSKPFYGVPESAEILTRDGWKNCDDLVVGEQVLTFNRESQILEWQPCLTKHRFPFDQEILRFRSDSRLWIGPKRDFRFTHEHRWPVRIGDGSSISLVEGQDLNSNHSFIAQESEDGWLDWLPFDAGTITSEHYKGRVWCTTTDNGTWVMRQNGGIVITGNNPVGDDCRDEWGAYNDEYDEEFNSQRVVTDPPSDTDASAASAQE